VTPETVALAAGILFLLIGVVGGGFSVEKAQIPQVPTWARVVSSLIGLAFLGAFVYTSLSEPDDDAIATGEAKRPEGADAVLQEDPGPALATTDGIEVSQILVTGKKPTPVGASVVIAYRLTNRAPSPVEFDSTFIGVRDPDNGNRDVEVNAGFSLRPQESKDFSKTLSLDGGGQWTIWPCYILVSGSSCPDGWRSFPLNVVDD
jgi:hypothetical protein